MTAIEVEFPIRTVNEANSHQHWRPRQRRAKMQRHAARAYVTAALVGTSVALPITVTVTRYAPSSGLDEHDGLPPSVKHIVDGIADVFGLADKDPRFTWRYAQQRGPYAVRIHIEAAS